MGPPLSTVAVLTFLSVWNDFLWPLVVISSPDRFTVQLGLQNYQSAHFTNWPLLMAGTVMSQLPVLAPLRSGAALLRQLDRHHGHQMRRVLAAASPPRVLALAPPRRGRGIAGRGRRATIVLTPHGTVTHPASQAVHKIANGGTIELRGGSYAQRVTFRGAHGITLRPYRGQHAELDGRRLTPPNGDSGLITIVNSSNITIDGLDVTGYRTTHKNVVPIGIYVHGHDSAIHIIGNHVHDLGNDNNTLGSFDINAHGIAAYGDDPQPASESS